SGDPVSVRQFLADPLDSHTLYVVNSNFGIRRTRDFGASWSDLPSPPPFLLTSVAGPGELLANTAQGVYNFDDSLQSWQQSLPAGIAIAYVHPSDPNALFSLARGQIRRSSDGGRSFVDSSAGIPAAPLTTVVTETAVPERVFSGGFGFFASADGGATWAKS